MWLTKISNKKITFQKYRCEGSGLSNHSNRDSALSCIPAALEYFFAQQTASARMRSGRGEIEKLRVFREYIYRNKMKKICVLTWFQEPYSRRDAISKANAQYPIKHSHWLFLLWWIETVWIQRENQTRGCWYVHSDKSSKITHCLLRDGDRPNHSKIKRRNIHTLHAYAKLPTDRPVFRREPAKLRPHQLLWIWQTCTHRTNCHTLAHALPKGETDAIPWGVFSRAVWSASFQRPGRRLHLTWSSPRTRIPRSKCPHLPPGVVMSF